MSDSVSKEQKKMLRHRWMPHLTSEEVVVLVHGLGGSSSIWFKQIKEYRKHFNLLIMAEMILDSKMKK
jgi:pimeloyl-ACP methyl ester carboxylesterase